MEIEMIKNKKACLFDLDGTLVDSMWMWKDIDIEYLDRFGIAYPLDLERQIEGMSFTETAQYFKKRFKIEKSIDEIKKDWEEMSIEKYRYDVKTKPGVYDFLEDLKSRGIKMAIATSNGRPMVDAVLDSLHLRPYFDSVITACEVAAGKPAPDIYLKLMHTFFLSPSACLVFEDIPAGIVAGKRAGMEVCAIEDAFSGHLREEKKKLADYFIEDYDEIIR